MLVFVLAHLMAPRHSLPSLGHTQGEFSFHTISCIVNEYTTKFFFLESPKEEIEAILANSFLSMAGNTDLAQFNYTSSLTILTVS